MSVWAAATRISCSLSARFWVRGRRWSHFFLAPFFGILIAIYMLLFSKQREIPYGPYLSLAAATVMVAYCPIEAYFAPGLRMVMEMILSRGTS